LGCSESHKKKRGASALSHAAAMATDVVAAAGVARVIIP
jgi:hypothetical protein